MRKIVLALLALAVLTAAAAPAAQATPMQAHTLASGKLRLDFLLMREAYNVRRDGNRLTFGTKSRCRPRGTIDLRLVRSRGDVKDVVSDEVGGPADEVSEREDGAGWAVTGGTDTAGALAIPTKQRRTFLVLRVQSTMYELCSIGHHREEWSEPLFESLALARLRVAPAAPAIDAPGRWDSFDFAVGRRSAGTGRAMTVGFEDIALPASMKPRVRDRRLVFGPAGPCALRGDVRLSLVASDAKEAEDVLREQVGPAPAGAITDEDGLQVATRGAGVLGARVVPSGTRGTWVLVEARAQGRKAGEGACTARARRVGFAAPLAVSLGRALVDAS